MAIFSSPATAAAGVLLATLIGSPLEAIANDYAYMTDGMSNFGVVDLARGVFTVCGKSGPVLTGLAVGPDHQLYSGMYSIKFFVAIDRTNGPRVQHQTPVLNSPHHAADRRLSGR